MIFQLIYSSEGMTDKCYPEVCPLQRQGLDFSTLISFTLKKTILQYWRRNGSTISLSAIGPKRWKIFGTKYGTKSVSAQLCHQFWEIMSIGKYCGHWSVEREREKERRGERGRERESQKVVFCLRFKVYQKGNKNEIFYGEIA
jgi:hypothetical protein